MENDNLNLRNMLSDFISNNENEKMRFLSSIGSDAKFNELNEENSEATEFHHSQFPDPSASFCHSEIARSFSAVPISYTDIDWSFNDPRLGVSSENWSHSIVTNSKNNTNASFSVRSPELTSSCRVPVRSKEAEGVHIIGCDIETNNHNLQSSGYEDQVDRNIPAIRSGVQPSCLEELDSETLDVECQTKAPQALNKTDKISGFENGSGDIPYLTTFSENSVDVRRSNLTNFSNFYLHPSSIFQPSIIIGEDNYFSTPSNEDNLSSAAVQDNDDILNSLKIAASSISAPSDSQIGLSSQSWFPDLKSCLLRRDQIQGPSEQKPHTDVRNFSSEFSTFAPSLGTSATISVPDQSCKRDG